MKDLLSYPLESSTRPDTNRLHTNQLQVLEKLQLPAQLNGSSGTNRATQGSCQLNANNDVDAINAWLGRVKDSPETFRNYRKEIERLLLWSSQDKQKSFSDLTLEDMYDFYDFLKNPEPKEKWIGPAKPREHEAWKPFERPLGTSSRKQALTIISSAFSFLVDANYLSGNPLRLFNKSQIRQQINNKDKVERYLEKDLWSYLWDFIHQLPVENKKQLLHKQRFIFLFSLLYLQAPRRSEISQAKMGDFFQEEGRWWWRVTGKGNKTAKIPVNKAMLRALMRYRITLGLPSFPEYQEQTPLLCSINRKKDSRTPYSGLTSNQIYKMIKSVLHQAANEMQDKRKASILRTASVHWFRHTSLTHQAESGVDLRYLQATARHASIETTQRYLHKENEEWHAEVNKHGI